MCGKAAINATAMIIRRFMTVPFTEESELARVPAAREDSVKVML
jgi:hypothetical protein